MGDSDLLFTVVQTIKSLVFQAGNDYVSLHLYKAGICRNNKIRKFGKFANVLVMSQTRVECKKKTRSINPLMAVVTAQLIDHINLQRRWIGAFLHIGIILLNTSYIINSLFVYIIVK